MEIAFYHATRAPADAVLPRLVAKALAGGHRIAIRSGDAARLKRLDALLWTHDPAGFLPHAIDTHARAAEQPCLLTAADTPANAATLMIALDGELATGGFARLLHVFDDADKQAARARWKALATPATYWKQTATGWEQAS